MEFYSKKEDNFFTIKTPSNQDIHECQMEPMQKGLYYIVLANLFTFIAYAYGLSPILKKYANLRKDSQFQITILIVVLYVSYHWVIQKSKFYNYSFEGQQKVEKNFIKNAKIITSAIIVGYIISQILQIIAYIESECFTDDFEYEQENNENNQNNMGFTNLSYIIQKVLMFSINIIECYYVFKHGKSMCNIIDQIFQNEQDKEVKSNMQKLQQRYRNKVTLAILNQDQDQCTDEDYHDAYSQQSQDNMEEINMDDGDEEEDNNQILKQKQKMHFMYDSENEDSDDDQINKKYKNIYKSADSSSMNASSENSQNKLKKNKKSQNIHNSENKGNFNSNSNINTNEKLSFQNNSFQQQVHRESFNIINQKKRFLKDMEDYEESGFFDSSNSLSHSQFN
ncbi:hypothetical protein PPERSA_05533 [Pseudocohnilembus persalinus]|uniref:Transmembrane protein n=1 Tax=Pseudocohnilembus persalinus TaxID=266149 RepID=A0A0V0QTT6_PSEPJ|nr:hypothetical protein PPERSA_05533 [Pseudocohnilembus persalinus]|eukprot:KRX05424.1 hypothetical protein PPERSA_05533 [Pseudocohnilembus persalinus]